MASEQWYHLQDGEAQGPFSARQLRDRVAGGLLRRNDRVRRGEQGSWVEASRVRGLFSAKSSESQLKRAQPLPPADDVPLVTEVVEEADDIPTVTLADESTQAPPVTPDIPVGTAVQPPAAQNDFQVQPAPTTPAGAIPQGTIPHGTPVSPATREEESDEETGVRFSPLMLTGGLLGVVVVILLVALVIFMNRGDDEAVADANGETDAATESSPQDPAALETDPGSVAATGAQPGEAEAPTADPAAAEKAALQAAASDALEKATKWSTAASTRYLVVRGVARVQVAKAWTESATSGTSQRLLVETRLINNSTENEPLGYSSWNGSGALGDKTRAIVFTADNEPLAFAEPDPRFPGTVASVSAGDTVDDILSFEVPADYEGDFHLALPRAAIGLPDYFRFEVTDEMVKLGTPPAASNVVVGESGQPAVGVTTASGELETTARVSNPAGDGDVPTIVVRKKDVKGTAPPSLDEINRQIKEFNEQTKEK